MDAAWQEIQVWVLSGSRYGSGCCLAAYMGLGAVWQQVWVWVLSGSRYGSGCCLAAGMGLGAVWQQIWVWMLSGSRYGYGCCLIPNHDNNSSATNWHVIVFKHIKVEDKNEYDFGGIMQKLKAYS